MEKEEVEKEEEEKEKKITVIIGATGTISKSLIQYLSTKSRNYEEQKEVPI